MDLKILGILMSVEVNVLISKCLFYLDWESDLLLLLLEVESHLQFKATNNPQEKCTFESVGTK